jgi:hypothetical protein
MAGILIWAFSCHLLLVFCALYWKASIYILVNTKFKSRKRRYFYNFRLISIFHAFHNCSFGIDCVYGTAHKNRYFSLQDCRKFPNFIKAISWPQWDFKIKKLGFNNSLYWSNLIHMFCYHKMGINFWAFSSQPHI